MASSSCPHCARPLPDGSSFCNGCGQPVSTATLRVEPTPELLAAAGKRARDEAPTAPSTAEALAAVRQPPPAPWVGALGVILLVALSLGAAVFILKRKNRELESRAPKIAVDVDVGSQTEESPAGERSKPTVDRKVTLPTTRTKKLTPRSDERATLDTPNKPTPSPTSAKPSKAPPSPQASKPSEAVEEKEEQIDPALVATALSADGVQFVVRAHLAQARACYERAFKEASPLPSGRLEIAFAINAQGKPARVRTVEDSFKNDQLARCIEQRLASWQFPRPVIDSDGEPEFQYPFVFSGR